MIALLSAAFCYLAFLLFETFALALDRLSPIKVPGLLEEHPERARILSGAGEVEIVRTTTKVVVQALLLTGLLTTVSGFTTFGVPRPWLWGGLFFVSGWLLTEIGLLRRDANRDPEKIVARLLPVIDGGVLASAADRLPDPADLRRPNARSGEASRGHRAGGSRLHRRRPRRRASSRRRRRSS